jgi:nucleotide-binding universal stress UspA family protein
MTGHRRANRGRPKRVDLLHSRAVRHERTEELLVAIEGPHDARGVLSVAELLARRDRINAHLVGVDNPSSRAAALTSEDRADLREGQQRRLLNRTRQLLHRVVGRAAFWTTDVALGELVTVVADESRKGDTRLVLVALQDLDGRRRSSIAEIVAIAHAVDVPILAVPRDQELLPTRVLVATDFSSASTRAARASISVLGPRGHLSLLHVEPEIEDTDSRQPSGKGIARLFDKLRRDLDVDAHASAALHRRRTSIVKDAVLVRGDPAATILDYADTHEHDLIVIGARRAPADDASPFGSVSTAVLHGAQCGVLVARAAAIRDRERLTDAFFKTAHRDS